MDFFVENFTCFPHGINYTGYKIKTPYSAGRQNVWHDNYTEIPRCISHGIPWTLRGKISPVFKWNYMGHKTNTPILQDRQNFEVKVKLEGKVSLKMSTNERV